MTIIQACLWAVLVAATFVFGHFYVKRQRIKEASAAKGGHAEKEVSPPAKAIEPPPLTESHATPPEGCHAYRTEGDYIQDKLNDLNMEIARLKGERDVLLLKNMNSLRALEELKQNNRNIKSRSAKKASKKKVARKLRKTTRRTR